LGLMLGRLVEPHVDRGTRSVDRVRGGLGVQLPGIASALTLATLGIRLYTNLL